MMRAEHIPLHPEFHQSQNADVKQKVFRTKNWRRKGDFGQVKIKKGFAGNKKNIQGLMRSEAKKWILGIRIRTGLDHFNLKVQRRLYPNVEARAKCSDLHVYGKHRISTIKM